MHSVRAFESSFALLAFPPPRVICFSEGTLDRLARDSGVWEYFLDVLLSGGAPRYALVELFVPVHVVIALGHACGPVFPVVRLSFGARAVVHDGIPGLLFAAHGALPLVRPLLEVPVAPFGGVADHADLTDCRERVVFKLVRARIGPLVDIVAHGIRHDVDFHGVPLAFVYLERFLVRDAREAFKHAGAEGEVIAVGRQVPGDRI